MKKSVLQVGLGFFFIIVVVGALFYREQRRVRSVSVTSWEKSHRADCAVVLTGGPSRIREGLNLLAQKRVQKVIISGAHPGATLEEIFPQWLFYGDLEKKDVILEKRSETTYGNARQSSSLIEALFCRDIVLITSRLHMYRAQRTFQAALPLGFDIYSRAVLHGDLDSSFRELSIEVVKSLFYSLFAYGSPVERSSS